MGGALPLPPRLNVASYALPPPSSPSPRQWDCSSYPCESDVATFYNHPVQSNPDEPRCWSTPQPKLCSACDNCPFCSEENWMASCVRKESLFHQFDRVRTAALCTPLPLGALATSCSRLCPTGRL